MTHPNYSLVSVEQLGPQVVRERPCGKDFLLRTRMEMLDRNISGCCRENFMSNDIRVEFPRAMAPGMPMSISVVKLELVNFPTSGAPESECARGIYIPQKTENVMSVL